MWLYSRKIYFDLNISTYLQFYNSEHEPYNLRNTELL